VLQRTGTLPFCTSKPADGEYTHTQTCASSTAIFKENQDSQLLSGAHNDKLCVFLVCVIHTDSTVRYVLLLSMFQLLLLSLFCRSFQANLNYYRLLSKVEAPLKMAGAEKVGKHVEYFCCCAVIVVSVGRC